ncbi:MAG: aminotransferase class III-fold pyridoxal phosphate-dependent enzyme [Cyclobacteriaceae bacterium]
MKKLIEQHFGFTPNEINKLDGYDNQNFLIASEDAKYIFKTYRNSGETLDQVEAENQTLLLFSDSNGYPNPVSFSDGSYCKVLEVDKEKRICRMLSFLEGQFFAEVEHSKNLFESFGRFLAQMDLTLQTSVNYTIQSRRWEWNITDLELNRKYIADIPEASKRSKVAYFFQQYNEHVLPVLPELRKSIIHNDANEWNILVKDDEVTGIIDFGDLAHSTLICELAVALTYACYDKEYPLKWAAYILNAYHRVLPLQEREISVLYYLIAARLCISVCNSAHSRKEKPENTYATSSEVKAWEMIDRWLAIGPIQAEQAFREAVGLMNEPRRTTEELSMERFQFISPILSVSYKNPIYMERAAFQYMYDAHGNSFLDAYNNIPHVGHSHPKVVEAGQRQMAKLNTNTRYLYDSLNRYAGQLLAKFPESLNKVFFVNSGSAASDLAIRLARAHTGRSGLMVMEHGYHGNTQIGIDISDYKFSNKAGQGQKEFIIKAPIPDTYRGKYSGRDAGQLYAKEAIGLSRQREIAAFITEPVVGCGGQVPLAPGYLKALYPEIRKQGGICISDEVQTGFGRLGDHYWGYEAQGVIPDLVILGKPMGNGHPIGAVVTTREIADSFSKGVEFFSSFGGNPVSCEIGSAVLQVIEDEGLQENARITGNYYQSLFEDLKREFPVIGDVRGSGLFIGVELVKDPDTKEPDTHLAQHIKNELRNRHILVSTDGPFDSVIKSKPPLCFTKANADRVVEEVRNVLQEKA